MAKCKQGENEDDEQKKLTASIWNREENYIEYMFSVNAS